MKMTQSNSRRRGFTLVELLTVIAIIGILAAILIPTVGTVMQKGRITAAGSNARQIGQAYNIYALSGPRIKNISATGTGTAGVNYATNVAQWAQILATYGGLDDGSFYFVSDDPNAPSAIPKTVLDPTDKTSLSSDFTSEAIDGQVAYTVVVDLPRNASATTAPIAWTRDLATDGSWPETAPWGTNGGHIVFLDGHVTWQRTTAEEDPAGDLIDPSSGSRTMDPLDAAGANVSGLTTAPTAYNE